MQHDQAVIGQKLGAALEESVVVVDADMFEHPDRHDAVERSPNVAIILQQKFCRSEVLLRRAGVRHLQLLRGQRDAGNVGTGHLGKIETKPAPARANVENAVAASDQELCRKVPLLSKLGVVKGGIRRLEIGAAILHVAVEEERIKPPVEIVE